MQAQAQDKETLGKAMRKVLFVQGQRANASVTASEGTRRTKERQMKARCRGKPRKGKVEHKGTPRGAEV